MSVILHASDLHFGTADPHMVELFLQEIERQRPHLVVLSGDFAQIGSHHEFRAAQQFIKRINVPVFVVPGNHDIPRYSVWERLTDPMRRYRKYISPIEDTVYEDDHCFVVGINTARPVLPHWNWANGMISQEQIGYVRRHFRYAPVEKARIFVCHHPLFNVKSAPIDTVVWGSTDLMDVLKEQKIDMVLTGHIHHASVLAGEGCDLPVMVGCASATSNRLRGQSNGYNIIRIGPDHIGIELVHWDGHTHVVFENISVPRQMRIPPQD